MERLQLRDDWPLPNEFMLELGRISITWSSLESMVNISISKLAGYSDRYDFRAGIMLAHSNFKQRIEILETLFEQCSKKFKNLENYDPIIKKIKNAQRGRNKFIHHILTLNPDNKKVEISNLSARGSMKVTVKPVRINELKEVSAQNHEAMCMLYSIITEVEILPIWDR